MFSSPPILFSSIRSLSICLALSLCVAVGCGEPDPIIVYSVPTKLPDQLRPSVDRMLAAMIPKGDQTWFIKVTGPENAIAMIDEEFRQFVESIEFEQGEPKLDSLPNGWQLGGPKPMRFASIGVETPNKQLDISVSSLPKQGDWEQEVAMNVNRWRGQVGLNPSNEKWAAAEKIDIKSADGPSVWVDLIGKDEGMSRSAPKLASALNKNSEMPQDAIHSDLVPKPSEAGPSSEKSPVAENSEDPKSRLKYDRPEGWRDGKMSSIRMAAFYVGPEDAEAELTIIAAGGDLRGNVDRWLKQIRTEGVTDEVVDQAMKDAEKVEIDGRESQRFLLLGENPEEGTAIDATIVPLEQGFSLFIKMTGPASTVKAESDAVKKFLKSIRL